MFSQLGPLFKTTFVRKAESNDTRQKIPHEEKDQEGRKQHDEPLKEQATDIWEDNTSVSVMALRAFLINFLKTMPEAQSIDIPTDIPQAPAHKRPNETQRPTNTKNAKAVRAYQSMAAQSAPPEKSPKSDHQETRSAQQHAGHVESKELRDIYTLIDRLDTLSGRGVEMLNIEKAGSFVESLKNAVAKIL